MGPTNELGPPTIKLDWPAIVLLRPGWLGVQDFPHIQRQSLRFPRVRVYRPETGSEFETALGTRGRRYALDCQMLFHDTLNPLESSVEIHGIQAVFEIRVSSSWPATHTRPIGGDDLLGAPMRGFSLPARSGGVVVNTFDRGLQTMATARHPSITFYLCTVSVFLFSYGDGTR